MSVYKKGYDEFLLRNKVFGFKNALLSSQNALISKITIALNDN